MMTEQWKLLKQTLRQENILYTEANALRWEGIGQAWAGYSEFKRGETVFKHVGTGETQTHTHLWFPGLWSVAGPPSV